ncbi:hypothetical protein KKD70_00895 [Patescibacteria group bacterium]|nr:hypothetical protein [Patescibacteria group bacterium]
MQNTSEIKALHLSEINNEQREDTVDLLKQNISQIISEIQEKIIKLNLQSLGIDKFRIALDLEGVLINPEQKTAMPYANYVLRELHDSLNESLPEKAEVIIWTSAEQIYATYLMKNKNLEVPKGMRLIAREDNINLLNEKKIPHTRKSSSTMQKIYHLISSSKQPDFKESKIIDERAKIPTLHNVHALIDDHWEDHRNSCVQANLPNAGNLILEHLDFGKKDSLIKALQELNNHINKITHYLN